MHIVATVAREIWLRRNVVIFGGEFLGLSSLIRRAMEQVDACDEADQRRCAREEIPRPVFGTTWQNLSTGWLKINRDAALDLHNNKTGIGVIIRNHEGVLVVMLCAAKGNVNEPTMAKAFGAWKAVNLAVQMNLRRIILEGDALIIVRL
jgi:hypothetical protein